MVLQNIITSNEFDCLYSEYKPKFIAIAKSYVHDEQIAEDLVTDSFVFFWEHRTTLSFESSPQAYIFGIVKKKCAMHLRDQRVHDKAHETIYKFYQWEFQQDLALLEDCELTRQLFSNDVKQIFNTRIQSLPEITRKVFLASRDENLTYQQIAGKYNLSVRQVDREMQRALSSLRIVLKDYLPMMLITLELFKNR